MNTTEANEILDDIAKLVDEALLTKAGNALVKLYKRKLPFNSKLRFATLARRAGNPALALRALSTFIKSDEWASPKALTEVKIEYVASLIRMGARAEGRSILRSLENRTHPGILLYEAFALVSEWNYAEAIPLLEKYHQHKDITSYQKAVALANIAAGHTFLGEWTKARELVSVLLENPILSHLLRGQVRSLDAQVAIGMGRGEDVKAAIRAARATVGHSMGLEKLFIEKWAAIWNLKQRKRKGEDLETVKALARTLGHWETLRDCDLWEALETKNARLLMHVFVGTPFPSYRARIEKLAGNPMDLPTYFDWRNHGKIVKIADPFDPEAKKPITGIGRSLLVLLSQDFYRHLSIAEIHSSLYPGERYHSENSPTKIHQQIKRLRVWLGENHSLIRVDEKHGAYAIRILNGGALRIRSHEQFRTEKSRAFYKLESHFHATPFSLEAAAKYLKLAPRTTLRLLQKGVEYQDLVKVGKTNRSRYQFIKHISPNISS